MITLLTLFVECENKKQRNTKLLVTLSLDLIIVLTSLTF